MRADPTQSNGDIGRRGGEGGKRKGDETIVCTTRDRVDKITRVGVVTETEQNRTEHHCEDKIEYE